MESVEDKYADTVVNAKQAFKKNIYDWLSAAIIVAIVIIGLDIFNLRDVNEHTVKSLFIEWVPFFLAATLLDKNLYSKGMFVGKLTTNYLITMQEYSKQVAKLDGRRLKHLPEFCKYKNDKVLYELQTDILKKEGISIDDFEELKKLPKQKLQEQFTKEQINAIYKAKNAKIVGLRVNLLLGSNNVEDETNLGPTEHDIVKLHTVGTAISYVGSTAIMTLIGLKDILLWGWAGILIILFKTAYIFVKAYMSYFKGYSDVTIKLVNHIVRKTDTLKEYDYYYDNNFVTVMQNAE